jgi:hypothetical protein
MTGPIHFYFPGRYGSRLDARVPIPPTLILATAAVISDAFASGGSRLS